VVGFHLQEEEAQLAVGFEGLEAAVSPEQSPVV